MTSGSVVTIGVFDGVHLGHQRILGRLREEADRRRLPAVVFSFEPVPQEVLPGRVPPARLMRWREKAIVLGAQGIDILFSPPFDMVMSRLTPEAFIEQLLVRTLAVRHLIVGDDFRFGHRRAGSTADLEAGGRLAGFTVEQAGSVVQDGERVSSTAVRRALAAGDLDAARVLLGRQYFMAGRVIAGQRLGRTLGFPTANLRLGRRQSPVDGIFAVRVDGLGPRKLDGVASVGTRPTVAGREPLLEVHIFDFAADIYGQHICVEFIERLRGEEHFPDLESMRRQMVEDAARARHVLAAH